MADAEQAARPTGDDTAPVLVARCENYREDVDKPCTGEIRYRWGQPDAACDTCGGRCGVAVAAWERVDRAATAPRAGADTEPDDARENPAWQQAIAEANAAEVRRLHADTAALRAAGNTLAKRVRGMFEARPSLWFEHRRAVESAVEAWQAAAQTGGES